MNITIVKTNIVAIKNLNFIFFVLETKVIGFIEDI